MDGPYVFEHCRSNNNAHCKSCSQVILCITLFRISSIHREVKQPKELSTECEGSKIVVVLTPSVCPGVAQGTPVNR